MPGQSCDLDIVTERSSVCCWARERMFLGGVFVQIDECEHLVQIYIKQLSYLVDQLDVVEGVDGNVISGIISYSATCNAKDEQCP